MRLALYPPNFEDKATVKRDHRFEQWTGRNRGALACHTRRCSLLRMAGIGRRLYEQRAQLRRTKIDVATTPICRDD